MTSKTIEQIDLEVRQDELEAPYYEELEVEHKKAVRAENKEYREFLLGQKYNSRIFGAKMEESLRDINDYNVRLDGYYLKLAQAGVDMKEWWMWLIDRVIDEKLEEEKQLRRWQFYRDKCLGKIKEGKEKLDVERAKEIPIADIMPYKHDKQCGKRRYYKCPMHNEKTGSFVEYVDQNSYACYGACGVAGDTIDLFMRLNNCDFVEAVRSLNKM